MQPPVSQDLAKDLWCFDPEACRIIRCTRLGLSDPSDNLTHLHRNIRRVFLQRLHFWEGYKYPSTFLWTASSPRKDPTIVASSSSTEISQSLHPNSLIFGGLKEKAPIYNFTKPFFISAHSLEGFEPRVSLWKT